MECTCKCESCSILSELSQRDGPSLSEGALSECAGLISIFLEYCAGGSVASLLEKFGPFSEQLAATYMRMVVHGLGYLHARHILHRDIYLRYTYTILTL